MARTRSQAPDANRPQDLEETSQARNEGTDNDTIPQGTPMTMEAFMQALATFGQANQLRRQEAQGQGRISEFKKLSPPSFAGTTDPLEAEKWLTELQKAFTVLRCTDEEKVDFATYMLQGDAYDWWLMVKRQHENDTNPFTWNMFKEAFNDKYFPKSVRQQKEREFVKLEQGSRSVTEYEAEFARLAKFAPNLVATEDRRARRFEEGLKPYIKQAVIPFELSTYREVVNKSLLVERAQSVSREEAKFQPNAQKYKVGNSKSWGNQGQKRRNDHGKQQNSQQNKQQKRTCPKCGKEHLGECLQGKDVCYKCGKPGHFANNCKAGCFNYGKTGHQAKDCKEQKKATPARVYAMSMKDAEESPFVVSGKCNLEFSTLSIHTM